VTHPTTALVLEHLGPTLTDDDDGTLEAFLDAGVRPLGEVDDIVRDTDAGDGWARELNPDTTSRPAWLGQFVGAVVPAGMTDAAARQLVRDRPAIRRGSPGAVRAAAQQHLSGTRRVDLFERDGGPYKVRVRVYSTQLPLDGAGNPDPEPVRLALMAAKPAGLTLTLEVYPGTPYDERDAGFATYDALDASATTYDLMDRGAI
jgi:hypothetical protein